MYLNYGQDFTILKLLRFLKRQTVGAREFVGISRLKGKEMSYEGPGQKFLEYRALRYIFRLVTAGH
jgi:hypothetical protein